MMEWANEWAILESFAHSIIDLGERMGDRIDDRIDDEMGD